MKIKLLVARSGADGSFAAGEVISVPADEGMRLITSQLAVAAADEKRTASKKTPETR